MGPEKAQNRSKRVSRVLCAADPRGSEEAIAALLRLAEEADVQAIAVVGDLSADAGDRATDYRTLFRALGAAGHPTFWVPGASDAPVDDYLREAYNVETVYPFVRGVHGTAAFAPGTQLVAGFGGEVDDDPEAVRDEQRRLRYPRWEVEYRLKILQHELAEHEHPILLFSTPPAHKGLGTPGSEALAQFAATVRARLVVCGGPPATMTIGRTLVVAPGSLAEGGYAVADVHALSAELGELSARSR
jgi:Icc-related predicted phosphoesterase